jgi:hypothetical protein
MSNTKLKHILANLLTLLVTLAICFFILEFGLARYFYTDVGVKSYKEFDPELGWINKTGDYSVKPVQSLFRNSFHINRYGLRNKEITPLTDNSFKRIVILGDSFAFANGIGNEDIFPTQLEVILNRELKDKYEVINAGVEGFGTVQEMLLMKRLAAQNIIGDSYVLMIFINDILDNLCLSYGDATENLIQPKYGVDNNNKLALQRAPQKILEESSNLISVRPEKSNIILFDLLKIQLQSYLQTKPELVNILNKLGYNANFFRIPGLINGWYDKNVLNRGVPLLKHSIEEIKNEAEKRNAKLYISLIPSPVQVYANTYGPILEKNFPNDQFVKMWVEDKLVPQNVIKKMCEELRIPFLDLYPILLKSKDEELYIPNEGHFTKNGHRIVAEGLANFILSYHPG